MLNVAQQELGFKPEAHDSFLCSLLSWNYLSLHIPGLFQPWKADPKPQLKQELWGRGPLSLQLDH